MRRRIRFRRKKNNALNVKLTRTIQVSSNAKTGGIYSLHQTLDEFSEFKNLAPNFEYVKVNRVRVRVYPQQNVSNNSTSRITNYALVPYHRPVVQPTVPNFPTCLSIDKAKIRRMTSVGQMNFVPTARVAVDRGAGESTLAHPVWRPQFDIASTAATEILYCGFLSFEGDNTITGDQPVNFTVVVDCYVVFKNQRAFI